MVIDRLVEETKQRNLEKRKNAGSMPAYYLNKNSQPKNGFLLILGLRLESRL